MKAEEANKGHDTDKRKASAAARPVTKMEIDDNFDDALCDNKLDPALIMAALFFLFIAIELFEILDPVAGGEASFGNPKTKAVMILPITPINATVTIIIPQIRL